MLNLLHYLRITGTLLFLFLLQEGRTALALASWDGCMTVVQVLVAKGADVNVQDEVRACRMYFTYSCKLST